MYKQRLCSVGGTKVPGTTASHAVPPSFLSREPEPGLQKVIGVAPSSSSLMLQVGAYVIRADAPKAALCRAAQQAADSSSIQHQSSSTITTTILCPSNAESRPSPCHSPFSHSPDPARAQQPRLTFSVHGERPEERVEPCWQQGPAPLNLQHTTSQPCTDHEYPRRSLAQMGLQREA